MLKRKPGFAFWLPLAAMGCGSLLAASYVSADELFAPDTYLSLKDAQTIIPDLKLIPFGDDSANPTGVHLTGSVPHGCAKDLKIETREAKIDGQNYLGFSILANGLLKDCKGDGKGSRESLSLLPNGTVNEAKTDKAKAVYLSHNDGDVNAGAWTAEKTGGKDILLRTQAAITADAEEAARLQAERDAEQARIAQEQKTARMRDNINNCIASNAMDDALENIRLSGLDDLTAAVTRKQHELDAKEAQALLAKIDQALKDVNIDAFDDLEKKLYAYLDDHPQGDDTALSDKFAGAIYKMAEARTQADGVKEEDIDKVKASLTKAIDPELGIHMSEANEAKFKQALQAGGYLDIARAEVAYGECLDVSVKRGPYRAASVCKRYASLAGAIDKNLFGREKAMNCVDRFGAPSEKRDSNASLDKACSAIENQREQLAELPGMMNQKYAEAIQRQRQDAALRMAPNGQMQQLGLGQQQLGTGVPQIAQSTFCISYPTAMGCSNGAASPISQISPISPVTMQQSQMSFGNNNLSNQNGSNLPFYYR